MSDVAYALPDAVAPIGEVVAWCAQAPLPLALAVVRETYLHGGWAVVAAMLAAGDAELPAPDALVGEVSRLASARFADAACDALEAMEPLGDHLDALGWPAPGGELVDAAFAQIADAVALADARAATARARLAHAFATADAVLAGAPVPRPPAEAAADTRAFVAWLAIESPGFAGARSDAQRRGDAIEADTAWTWASVEAWRRRDPLAPGKALVRVAGLPIASTLDEIRIAIANQLDELAPLAWQRAIAEARAELAETPASPLVGAIVELGERAAAYAAHRLADAGDRALVLAQLLGDPRDCREAWEPSAPAIRAALGGA